MTILSVILIITFIVYTIAIIVNIAWDIMKFRRQTLLRELQCDHERSMKEKELAISNINKEYAATLKEAFVQEGKNYDV